MTDHLTPEQRTRIREVARDLLDHRAAGGKLSPDALRWAELNAKPEQQADPVNNLKEQS